MATKKNKLVTKGETMKKLVTSTVLALTMIATTATAANAVGSWPY